MFGVGASSTIASTKWFPNHSALVLTMRSLSIGISLQWELTPQRSPKRAMGIRSGLCAITNDRIMEHIVRIIAVEVIMIATAFIMHWIFED